MNSKKQTHGKSGRPAILQAPQQHKQQTGGQAMDEHIGDMKHHGIRTGHLRIEKEGNSKKRPIEIIAIQKECIFEKSRPNVT